jgi:uncharacterized HAD superfamily protein
MYGAADFLRELRAEGWGIVIITSRKTRRHHTLERDTHRWLEMNDIPYDRVIFAYDKATAIEEARLPLRFFVEDTEKHALDVAASGIPTIQITSNYRHLTYRHFVDRKLVAVEDMGVARTLWYDAFLSTDGGGGREEVIEWARR